MRNLGTLVLERHKKFEGLAKAFAFLNRPAGCTSNDSFTETTAVLRAELPAEEAGGAVGPELAKSDLVVDVYEGGFKVWECARDLLEVMHDLERSGELRLEGAAVLEGDDFEASLTWLTHLSQQHLVEEELFETIRSISLSRKHLEELFAKYNLEL